MNTRWKIHDSPSVAFHLVDDRKTNFNFPPLKSASERTTKVTFQLKDIIRQSGSKRGSSGSNGPSLANSSIDVASEQSYFGCSIVSFYSQFIWLCKLCRRVKGRKKKFQDWRKYPHFPPSGHSFVIVWTPCANEWRLKDARNIFESNFNIYLNLNLIVSHFNAA